jgi:hypothetical protein
MISTKSTMKKYSNKKINSSMQEMDLSKSTFFDTCPSKDRKLEESLLLLKSM